MGDPAVAISTVVRPYINPGLKRPVITAPDFVYFAGSKILRVITRVASHENHPVAGFFRPAASSFVTTGLLQVSNDLPRTNYLVLSDKRHDSVIYK